MRIDNVLSTRSEVKFLYTYICVDITDGSFRIEIAVCYRYAFIETSREVNVYFNNDVVSKREGRLMSLRAVLGAERRRLSTTTTTTEVRWRWEVDAVTSALMGPDSVRRGAQ